MVRKPIIAGNWKMFKTTREAVPFVRELIHRLAEISRTEIIISPSFVHLSAVSRELAGSNIQLAAQNVSHEDEGAFTGEVSAPMLVDIGCTHVIIGHSERRQLYGETDETANHKVRRALQHGLKPILCVGETLEERESGLTYQVVERQVLDGLSGLDESQLESISIAYEPVWAIGTGRTATPDQGQEVHGRIRALMEDRYGHQIASEKRILYGGSVKPENIAGLIRMLDIDGALVGGACLKADSFCAIVFSAEEECANI